MAKDTQRGNRAKDYKEDALLLDSEYKQVRAWRQRIRRSMAILDVAGRTRAAEEGDKYLEGTKNAKNGRAVYLNYLLPAIEDLHRRTLPRVPVPRVEAQDEAGEPYEDKIRQIIARSFTDNAGRVEQVSNELIWDDDRFCMGIGKTTWESDYEPATPSEVTDTDQIALDVDRATEEHADIMRAKVAENDMDDVHLKIHIPLMDTMMPGDPNFWFLYQHISEHRDRMTVVKREHPVLERTPTYRFVYDTDVPWHKRAWEAELKSERIQKLLDKDYRNINKDNLQLEVKSGETQNIPFGDMTARIWEIHDRSENKFYIIPADGPQDALFLHKGKWEFDELDIYLPLVFRPYKPEKTHGASTIQLAIAVLDELATVDFHIRRHVEMHSDYKTYSVKGSLSAEDKSAMNDPNRRHIELSPEAILGFKEQQPPAIPPTLLEFRELLLSELRRLLGNDAQDTGASNPHRVTATESAHRGEVRQERKTDRQEIMGKFLGRVANNFLSLYRKFGTLAIRARVLGPEGATYPTILPADIPEDLDVFFDIRGESEEAKMQEIDTATRYKDFLLTGVYPTDWQKFTEWYGRKMGVRRPEQFRLELPQGVPSGAQPMGQPGVPNENQPMQFPGGQQMPQEQNFAPAPERLIGQQ
uniref:Portal protein n=1 Tax=viral metagenome TaxID=1070528 RepID=A0A6M3LAX4_9ZZZZ